MNLPSVQALASGQADFVQSTVSIIVSGRDARLRPSIARALGCRVDADGRRVTVFLRASQSSALLADLRENGVIAVVVSDPDDHRSLQIKGVGAQECAFLPEDSIRIAAYADAFTAKLIAHAMAEAVPRTLLACTPGDVVAIAFTPTAVFEQTPGPGAGARLP